MGRGPQRRGEGRAGPCCRKRPTRSRGGRPGLTELRRTGQRFELLLDAENAEAGGGAWRSTATGNAMAQQIQEGERRRAAGAGTWRRRRPRQRRLMTRQQGDAGESTRCWTWPEAEEASKAAVAGSRAPTSGRRGSEVLAIRLWLGTGLDGTGLEELSVHGGIHGQAALFGSWWPDHDAAGQTGSWRRSGIHGNLRDIERKREM